jgi:signal transduction histidine kinase
MSVPRPRPRRPAWLHWPRTARLRFTVVYGSLFLASGAALVAVTYVLFQRATATTRPQLPKIPHTPSISALLPFAAAGYSSNGALPQLELTKGQLAQVQQALGQGVVPRAAAKDPLMTSVSRLGQDQRQLTHAINQLASAEHLVARNQTVATVQRAADSHQLLVNSGIALAIVAVLALLIGWLVAGRMLRPLRTITRTAQRISSSSLHERLALDGPRDELKELGDTLDDLFARLEAAFEAQRRFVANASHELRTPLTRERALVQVALGDPSTSDVWRTTARELLASNREQETLIDALLTLASSESGLDHHEQIDLEVVADSVLRRRRGTDRLGLRIDAHLAPAPLQGDPRLLEALVTNLVDNAVTHNVEGGEVHVSTGAEHGRSVLTVSNSGTIIQPGDFDRLFQPFQRLDPQRIHHNNGHGIGLSIVRAIATAHGATITADPRAEGGVSIEVAFPHPADTRVEERGSGSAR